jgi:hypothetical protein
VLAHRSNRNADHIRSLSQGQVLIKDQVQSLLLPRRQLRQNLMEPSLCFGSFQSYSGIFRPQRFWHSLCTAVKYQPS